MFMHVIVEIHKVLTITLNCLRRLPQEIGSKLDNKLPTELIYIHTVILTWIDTVPISTNYGSVL